MDADCTELATLTERFFQAVSFEKGHIPAYGRIRALFIQGGKLINNSSEIPEIWTVEGFIASRRKMVDSGALLFCRGRDARDGRSLWTRRPPA
jgi:hypothetical protein